MGREGKGRVRGILWGKNVRRQMEIGVNKGRTFGTNKCFWATFSLCYAVCHCCSQSGHKEEKEYE